MPGIYKIEFQGSTLMDAEEGEFFFQRGLKPARLASEDVIGGVVFKYACQGAAEHRLTLNFSVRSLTAATIESTVYNRLQNMWNGETGTLKVPGFVDLPNCIITGVDTGDQAREQVAALSSGVSAPVDSVGIPVVITFAQG